MATDLEKLVVQLSADIKGYEREMARAIGVTNTQARAIEKRYTQMGRNLDSIGSSAARSLIAPLSGIVASLGVREVTRYADAWTKAGSLIASAGQIAGTAGRPLEGINEIATATRGDFQATAELYAKLLRSTAGIAQSENEVARATEIVNKAFKAGGSSASEMAAGVLQLAQGLQSGVLAGDELRSVRENAPLLAQAIADYFGTTIGGLKKLGEEGKLTSAEIFKAILAAQPKIEAAFGKTNATIGDGITLVNNALTQYIGQTDKGLSGSQRLVAGLTALANNFDNVADTTLKVAAIIAGALVGRSIVGMVSKLGVATTAILAFGSALRAATSVGAAVTAIGGLSAAAGPLGLIIGGTAVAALALFGTQSGEATAAANSFAEALKLVENNAKASGEASATAGRKYIEAQRNTLTGGVGVGETEVQRVRNQIEGLIAQYDVLSVRRVIAPAQLAQIDALVKGFRTGEATAEETRDALYRLANSSPNFQKLAEYLGPLLEQLNNATKATSLLKSELGKLGSAAPTFRESENKSMQQYEALKKASDAYIADLQKRNALSKDALAIETEIAKIKKDADAKGVFLSPGELRRQATDAVAADARRGLEGKTVKKTADDRIDADIQQIKDRTVALAAERQNLDLSTEAQETRRVSLQLQQAALASLREEARRKGETDLESITLSEDQVARIDAVAAAYGREAAALERANGPLRSYAREAADTNRQLQEATVSGLRGFEDALIGVIQGTQSAQEAFHNMANAIIADLIRIAIRKSITGPIAGFLGFSDGGLVGSGKGGTGGNLGGLYATGGFTGAGGKYQPAGIVHRGEYVLNQDATRRIGVGTLDRLNKGYADGGYVGPMSMPAIKSSGSGARPVVVQITSAPVFQAGMTPTDMAAIEARLQESNAQLRQQVQSDLHTNLRNDADFLNH